MPECSLRWRLPAGLQIISYSGSGLSFRITGDTLFFWDNLSTDPNDTVSRADFGIADTGVTFNYDPVVQLFGAKSVLGSNGVLRAASSSDIGSPGRITAPPPDLTPGTNTPPAQPVGVGSITGENMRIEFEAIGGFRYTLEVRDDLATGDWLPAGATIDAATSGRTYFEIPRTNATRFFRLRVE